jgi:hypothetical protein
MFTIMHDTGEKQTFMPATEVVYHGPFSSGSQRVAYRHPDDSSTPDLWRTCAGGRVFVMNANGATVASYVMADHGPGGARAA